MKRRSHKLRQRYGPSKAARKRASLAQARQTIHVANPGHKGYSKHRYLLWFGAHAPTYVLVYENNLDDALDEAVDYIKDKWPGLLATSEVNDEYNRLVAGGMSEEEAQEQAEMDTTTAGNESDFLHSWEWGIEAEDPTREQILQLQGRLKS